MQITQLFQFVLLTMLLEFLIFTLCGVASAHYGEVSQILRSVEPELLWRSSAAIGSTKCAKDMNATLFALAEQESYAFRMLDACAKFPEALLLGNNVFLGQYDECLSVSSVNDEISGKYCLLRISIPDLNGEGGLGNGLGGLSYEFGICVASSCSADDLNQGFVNANLGNVLLAIEEDCIGAHDEKVLDTGAWIGIAFLLVLVAISLASTTYEIWQRFHVGNDKPHELLTSFSIFRNGKIIFEVKDQSGQMDCLNGMRTLSMFWVVYCHNAIMGLAGSTYNNFEVFTDLMTSKYIIATAGYLSVDTFFFLGGLLVAFVFFRDMGRSKTYDVPRSYLNRYLRLTPPYAMMVLFEATLLKYMGDGPLWYDFYSPEVATCKKWWWTGLLYVQNLVNPNEMCLLQSWYLSADMQIYILAPIFLYALYLRPKLGLIFAFFMTIASSFWTFGIAYAYELPFTPFFDTTGEENRMDSYPFWSKISVWLVGVLLGSLICDLKSRNIEVKLKPWAVIGGWLISSALCCVCLFGSIWFFDNPGYTVAQTAAFSSFHRLGWAIGLAWIVFACVHGYGGPINGFLSWGFFQPLGKLSYCMYLVHITVIYVVYGTQRVTRYITPFNNGLDFISLLVVSNLVAIPLALLVEMPTMALDRYFLRSIKVFPYPRPKVENEARNKEAVA